MNQPIIAFIRHAHYLQQVDAPSAFQPHPLSEQGWQQAVQCAQQISEFCSKYAGRPIYLHCSSLLRAWQTADAIATQLDNKNISVCAFRQTEQLCERSVGGLANLTVADIEQILQQDPRVKDLPKDWKSDSYFCLPVPGAESLMQAGQRVATYIQSQISNEPVNSLHLFVGHGASIRHAAYQLGILKFEQIKQLSMHYAQPVIYQKTDAGYRIMLGEWKVRAKHSQYRD
ncbi:histidine phosphatase family protein [Gayadomonas joobiniege]|uniref:histidine phosphatase family protein n=1 Tax=Gayadomonas joobiniege TaxID=1234606 RepID=UPI000364254C|nr:histidine phosphatase family protein [Gayadomonas joobiniege]